MSKEDVCRPSKRHFQGGQWSLIGTLVAVAILIVLAALYLPRMLKTSGGTTTQEQTATQEAYGVACTEYVSQMNQAVMMYKQSNNGQPPRSLQDLKPYGVTSDMLNAPGCTYQMDPATGTVSSGPAPGPGMPGRPPTAAPGSGTPAPNGGTRGPGGITIPNIPGASSGL